MKSILRTAVSLAAVASLAATSGDAAPLRRQAVESPTIAGTAGTLLSGPSGVPTTLNPIETPVPVSVMSVPTGTSTATATPTGIMGQQGAGAAPQPIIVPQITLGSAATVMGSAAAAATSATSSEAIAAATRQVMLNSIINAVTQQAQESPSAAQTSQTLAAVVTAHQYYSEVVSVAPQAASTMTTGTGSPAVSQAAEQLYTSILAHVATQEGAAMVQNLMQTDASYAAADQAAAANRADECQQLQTDFGGQYGQISANTRQCMCDFSQPYSLCRMLLANDMNTQTVQNTNSTANPGFVANLAAEVSSSSGSVNGGVTAAAATSAGIFSNGQLDPTNNWQPSNGNNSVPQGPIATMANNFIPYNPLTGEIGMQACIGEGFELCIKGDGYVPSFKTVLNSISNGDQMLIQTCVQGKCTDAPAETFAGSAANALTSAAIELSVSLCLGLPGLTEVLNDFGISLCYNLLTADFYPLQGPLGQLSTGLNLFIVKLSAFGKMKLANASPVCPQDFNNDMLTYSCAHPKVYQTFVDEFAGDDFCNLSQGQGILGASIVVDLWFWSKEWDFAQTPNPRPAPTCTNGQPSNNNNNNNNSGNTNNNNNNVDLGQFNCYDARVQYLKDNPDVAHDSEYGSVPGARQHYLDHGKQEGRVWHGELCLHEDLFCYAAQIQYWSDSPDVASNSVYGASTHNGAWLHFQQYGKSEGRIWHGELCLFTNTDCPAADQSYLNEYPDVAQDPFYGKNPFAHYQQHGRSELRDWNGQLCLKDIDCPRAEQQYLSDYPDVARSGVNPWAHYNSFGKQEGRYWHGGMCL